MNVRSLVLRVKSSKEAIAQIFYEESTLHRMEKKRFSSKLQATDAFGNHEISRSVEYDQLF